MSHFLVYFSSFIRFWPLFTAVDTTFLLRTIVESLRLTACHAGGLGFESRRSQQEECCSNRVTCSIVGTESN